MPPGVVTVISVVPADPAGTPTIREVAELYTTDDASVVPNLTIEPTMKLVPVIPTRILPAVGPTFGVTELTVGIPI